MLRELLRWLAGGVTGILQALLQVVGSGAPISTKLLLSIVVTMVLYRLGSWLVLKFGPKPE